MFPTYIFSSFRIYPIFDLNLHELTLKPSFTYLFSYVWLALELIIFLCLILAYIPNSYGFSTFFFLVFARFYWWMNFSPDSAIQTLFILGMIPIQFLFNYWLSPVYLWIVFSAYIFMLLATGLYRIHFMKYNLSKENVSISLFKSKTWAIDQKRQIGFTQNPRGRLLNFGCLLIPVRCSKKVDKGLVYLIFMGQRSMHQFSNFIRVDGIKNIEKVFIDIKQKFYEKG